MEKDNSLKLFITAFVVVVLALAFIVSIADQTRTVTERTQTSQTFAGAGCFTPVNLTGTDFTTLHTQANGQQMQIVILLLLMYQQDGN